MPPIGVTSETHLEEVPANYRCNLTDLASAKCISCRYPNCQHFGPAHKKYFCRSCIRQAACEACDTPFDLDLAVSVPSRVISSTYVSTEPTSLETASEFAADLDCEHQKVNRARDLEHYCFQRGSEDLHGRPDDTGRFYCSYCCGTHALIGPGRDIRAVG